MSTIIGIDPGSRITGYGVIHSVKSEYTHIASGCIQMKTSALSGRLGEIFAGIQAIMLEFKPDEACIEQVFFHRNVNAALKLGQARGAAIVAASQYAIPVSEYSARQIKQSVVGYGAAKKEQVQHMVRYLLKLNQPLQADAADALACALCHAHYRQSILARIEE